MDARTLAKKAVEAADQITSAQQPHFFVEIGGLKEHALAVESFQSDGLALSACGAVTVDVLVRVAADIEQWIGKSARLRLVSRTGGDSMHALTVAEVVGLPDSPEGSRMRLTLESPMSALRLQRHNRVFLERSIEDIITAVMEGAGVPADSLDIALEETHPVRELVVQYEESDYAFMQRLLAREGVFYTVKYEQKGSLFVFRDNSQSMQDALGTVRLDYHRESGQGGDHEKVIQVNACQQWLSKDVALRDYNSQTPQRLPHGQASCQGAGEGVMEYWGPGSEDGEDAERLAQIRAQALDARRQSLRLVCDSPLLQPGMQLLLGNHPRYEGPWLVVASRIQGDQRAGHAFGQNSDRPGLLNELTLVPSSLPWRSDAAWQRAPVHGQLHARVEGDGGDYAYLDDQGRYRVRLPFDQSGCPEGEASPPLPMMQPYGGANSGLHLPLHAGTEVAISWLNGDVDRPFIVGALSNPETPSPVTSQNPSQNILRTRGGNELLMEDRAGERRIELFTADRQNRLSLDAADSGHQVTLETVEGDMQLVAGGNMTTEVGGSQNETVGADKKVTVKENMELLTQEGNVQLQAGEDIVFHARRDLKLSADEGSASIRSGADMLIESGDDFSLDIPDGNASIRAPSGDLTVEADGAMTFIGGGNGPMRIGQGGGVIEITASGDVIIQSANIELSGDVIKVDGQQIGNN
ncbi:MAG: hypothetical protein C0462_09630 [Alcanivorax sp.]|nr:hypothetical protein [Alcanivorax sp.]